MYSSSGISSTCLPINSFVYFSDKILTSLEEKLLIIDGALVVTYCSMHFSYKWTALNPRMENITALA